jgi:REP element-mobilizing transposase RayT
MARNRYRFAEHNQLHFLTCTVVEWLPVFTRQEAVAILLDSWRYLGEHKDLKLYGDVVLENHLHAVAQAEDLPPIWSGFKSYTALEIIDLLEANGAEALLKRMRFSCKAHRNDREHQFWQEGSHPQVIENEVVLRKKLDYIHNNPVKRGYVDRPEHWRWSSARNYAGETGLLEVFTHW